MSEVSTAKPLTKLPTDARSESVILAPAVEGTGGDYVDARPLSHHVRIGPFEIVTHVPDASPWKADHADGTAPDQDIDLNADAEESESELTAAELVERILVLADAHDRQLRRAGHPS